MFPSSATQAQRLEVTNRRPTTSGARRLAVLCWLVQPAVVQVATSTIVHSGNLLSGFDETFETSRLALMELFKHLVCEMDTCRYHTTLATKPTAVVPSTKRPCGVLLLSHIAITYALS